MSDDSFDPAVVTLLGEIAADPRASLLRIPKERLIRWIGRPEEVVKPSGSYLTKAEKHLVSAYREEAAWLLLQACVVELNKHALVFSKMAPDSLRLKEEGRRLSRLRQLSPEAKLATRQIADMGAVALGSASLRLSPNDHARNCLAIALQRAGHDGSSMQLLRVLLSGEPNAVQKAQAFENMMFIWASKSAFERAHECGRQAIHSNEECTRLLVWGLTTALQMGNEGVARAYAMRIDEAPKHHEVVQISLALTSTRRERQWEPTASSLLVSQRLRGEVCQSVREICDAFS